MTRQTYKRTCRTEGGEGVYVIVPPRTLGSFVTVGCFRGTHVNKAGNFSIWNTLCEFWHSMGPRIITHILGSIRECRRGSGIRRDSFRLELKIDSDIGWDRSARRNGAHGKLEPFSPVEGVVAFRVHRTNECRAPMTPYVTVAYQILRDPGNKRWFVVMTALHPGRDVDPKKDGGSYVFFHHEHPGQEIIIRRPAKYSDTRLRDQPRFRRLQGRGIRRRAA